MEAVSSIDFQHSSRKAWQRINLLTGRTRKKIRCPIEPNAIAKQIVQNAWSHRPNKTFTRSVLNELRAVSASDCNLNHHLGLPFTKTELEAALKLTQHRKALGPDGVPNKLLTNCGETLLNWMLSFVNACLANNFIPKMWRRASVVAILKPGKASSSPESYCPISLLCPSFKLFERLILKRASPSQTREALCQGNSRWDFVFQLQNVVFESETFVKSDTQVFMIILEW